MSTQLFRAIVPGRVWDIPGIQRALKQDVSEVLDLINQDFKSTVRTWDHQVDFKKSAVSQSSAEIKGNVGTDDAIYGYVTHGTRPHTIRPKHARLLRFQTGYRAKTSRRVLGSHGGGASGDFVVAKAVHHPGTDAREFEEEIQERRQKSLESRVKETMLRFAKE